MGIVSIANQTVISAAVTTKSSPIKNKVKLPTGTK